MQNEKQVESKISALLNNNDRKANLRRRTLKHSSKSRNGKIPKIQKAIQNIFYISTCDTKNFDVVSAFHFSCERFSVSRLSTNIFLLFLFVSLEAERFSIKNSFLFRKPPTRANICVVMCYFRGNES